jgi:glycosyltransferase involved in cell wall biosynthesis
MKQFKLSCIIPVYNGEKFIENCLNTILTQNFKNLEIIIINDASTDKTRFIIEKIMKQDSRVRIYNNLTNKGVSVSRNCGILKATGTHIHFIDSDDSLQPNAYDCINDFFINNSSDIIIFDYHKLFFTSLFKLYKTRKLKENTNLADTIKSKSEVLKNGGVVVWNKIFSVNFLLQNNIKFIENIIYEDIPFFWSTTLLANSIYYIKTSLYSYNYRTTSIMNTKLTIHKAKYIIISMSNVKKFLISNNYWNHKEYKILYIKKLFQTYVTFLSKIKTKKPLLFNKMYNNLHDIDLEDIKSYTSKWKYWKYSLLKNNRYYIWVILF